MSGRQSTCLDTPVISVITEQMFIKSQIASRDQKHHQTHLQLQVRMMLQVEVR